MASARTQLARGLGALLTALTVSASAHGESLSAEARRVVEARLSETSSSRPKLTIAEGDTVLLEKTLEVNASRLRGPQTDYEGLVTGVTGPEGVVVHRRLDSFRFEPAGSTTKVHVVYAIHVDPGTGIGGRLKLDLTLVERKGLANVITKSSVTHWVKVDRPSPSQVDLRADFEGYHLYAAEAQRQRRALAKRGLRVSLRDDARMPPLARARPKAVRLAYDYEKSRRRMWIAHRHLITASQSPDRDVAAAARAYLANLDKPRGEWSGLPAVSLVEGSTPPPRTAEVETLEPVASEPAPAPSGGSGDSDVLAPVATYDPNVERDASASLPPSRAPRPEPTQPPSEPAAPAAKPTSTPDGAGVTPDEELVYDTSDDPFSTRAARRYRTIPGYTRGLVLDDPNVAHGGAFRVAWANVRLREQASTVAVFFDAQVAFTRTFGLELTVPTQYVSVDLGPESTSSIYAMGNPLIAAKYRIFLPDVLGRRPALTVRARAGIPIAPLHSLPLITSLDAEDFTRDAYFADTYAFFLEKADVGLGASLAWQWNILRIGAQAYLDYFIPVSNARDPTDFLAISWGASAGVLPFGEIVGFYAEARAVSLLSGLQRTELFTYLGARGRFFDYLEPALWVALPLGSVRTSNVVQVGAELRFSYDLAEVIDPSRGSREDVPLLD